MRIKRVRSERKAIFTEGERQLLLSGVLANKTLKPNEVKARSKLFAKLNSRFPYLLKDLDFLATNPSLENWRHKQLNVYNSQLWQLRDRFDILLDTDFKPVYLDRIVCKKDRSGINIFWVKKYNIGYSDRIYYPTNLTKGLKRLGFKKETIENLVEAYRKNLIPHDESLAKSYELIKSDLDKKTKNQPAEIRAIDKWVNQNFM